MGSNGDVGTESAKLQERLHTIQTWLGNASEALSQLGMSEAQALVDEAMILTMDELFTLEREEDGEF